MSSIVVSEFQVPDVHLQGSTAKLRLYADGDWTDSLGVPHLSSPVGSRTGFFQEIPLTISGSVITDPSFSTYSTVDARQNSNVRITGVIFDQADKNQHVLFENWFFPTSPNPITWDALQILNQGQPLLWPPPSYLNAVGVQALIDAVIGFLRFATSVIAGWVRLSVPAAVTSDPVAVGDNDRRMQFAYNVKATAIGAIGNGVTDDMAALNTLAQTTLQITGAGGDIYFPPGTYVIGSDMQFPANVRLKFDPRAMLKPANGVQITIAGAVEAGTSQIFTNANSGQGTVRLDANYRIQKVYPEWWGASPSASAAINTPAIQAAIRGAYGTARVNGSGLQGYNRILHFSGLYNINDELKCYHMIGFTWTGEQKFASGLQQTVANKRIIDGQSVAYGVFFNMAFFGGAASNVALVDIDYDTSQGADLAVQNITFYDCVVQGLTFASAILPTNFIGVHLCKSGQNAQGDNVRFDHCYLNGFSEAGAQLGTAIQGAQNALNVRFTGGDIQGCPKHALAAYGGNWIVDGPTLENGNIGSSTGVGQTDFELYAVGSILPNVARNVRSESMMFAWGNWEVTNCSVLGPQVTYNTLWINQPGAASFVNQLVTGTPYGGDGIMYLVSNVGTYGGLVDTVATGGSLTTVVKAGAGWTVNQFQGQRVTLMSGSGKYQYGVITANDATTLTVAAGFVSNYAFRADTGLPVAITAPDATSHFVIEPNWNAGAITSGTVNMTALSYNAVDGTNGFVGLLDNFNAGYGTRIRLAGSVDLPQIVKRLAVTRSDWLTGNTPLLDSVYASVAMKQIEVRRPNALSGEKCIWAVSRNGPNQFTDFSQNQVGSEWMVWSKGMVGGGLSFLDVALGRGDGIEYNDVNAVSRNVLAYQGMLGRKTPAGTNQAGLPTQIQGGLASGSGAPGKLELWGGPVPGASAATIRPGARQAYLDYTGLHLETGVLNEAEGAVLSISGNAIVPTNNLHRVNDAGGLIKNITVPTGFVSGVVWLIAGATPPTADVTGNVGRAITTWATGQAIAFAYCPSSSKWYPTL